MKAMAVVPDPHKLLLPDPDYVPTFWTGKFFPAFMAAIGFAGACVQRGGARQPILSGLPLHLAATAIGLGFGIGVQKWYDDRNMERDAVLRHYIALHPEDFPIPERKKVGEIFPNFIPVR